MFWAEAKTSNCKPGLLSLSGYVTYAGWPPHTNTEYCTFIWGSKFFCCLQINTQMNKHPFRAMRTQRAGCAVASCHQRVQTICPHHPWLQPKIPLGPKNEAPDVGWAKWAHQTTMSYDRIHTYIFHPYTIKCSKTCLHIWRCVRWYKPIRRSCPLSVSVSFSHMFQYNENYLITLMQSPIWSLSLPDVFCFIPKHFYIKSTKERCWGQWNNRKCVWS